MPSYFLVFVVPFFAVADADFEPAVEVGTTSAAQEAEADGEESADAKSEAALEAQDDGEESAGVEADERTRTAVLLLMTAPRIVAVVMILATDTVVPCCSHMAEEVAIHKLKTNDFFFFIF